MLILLYTITIGVSLYASSYLFYYPRKFQELSEIMYPIHDRIERIRKIEDIIKLLQFLARTNPTEDVADKIVAVLNMNALSDESVQRLSRLHMKYGSDNGIKGYAINMLWSCIVLQNSSD
tara:strand:+ start:67 stop:426 length:360 start_codon:yes stop_codon:yes gene_type:complete